ncbi:hypothetical protein Scep_006995 [Stephania cephalantha]|uniref:Uncharacterized protein n=1 Tax=Stephania cephalantha TaxID=152367 RepID=A0AAP0PKM5_9MAGN
MCRCVALCRHIPILLHHCRRRRRPPPPLPTLSKLSAATLPPLSFLQSPP